MIRSSLLLLSCLASLAPCVSSAAAGDGPWYVGVGGGVSRLTPDTDGSRFELEESGSSALGVFGGRDVGSRYAIELGATRLGEAGLSGDESIAYTVLSGGVIGYVLGEPDRVRRGEGVGGFLRLGLGAIDNESDVPLEREDNLSIWAGVGLDVPFARSWAFRAELASFDGDAQAAVASLVWRPVRRTSGRVSGPIAANEPPAGTGVAPREPASPSDGSTPPDGSAGASTRATTSMPTPDTTRAPASRPAPTPRPEVSAPGATAAPDRTAEGSPASCPPSSGGGPLDSRGCPLFDGVRPGIAFAPGTAVPTAEGERALARLAGELLAHPEITVEIRAHAGDGADAAADKALSRERAIATARALAGRGVPVARLRARAFGLERAPADAAVPAERIELGTVAP